ncbi:MAG: amino acid racemase [Pseudomonadota bacterium]
MKTIGLIGGMSWLSTIDYYRAINQDVGERLGGVNNARVVMVAINVADALGAMARKDYDGTIKLLTDAAQNVEAGGAHLLAMCANSAHIFADQVQDAVDIPLVGLIEPVAEAIKLEDVGKVGILASTNLVENGLYSRRLNELGIDTVLPDTDKQDRLQEAIEEGIEAGSFAAAAHAYVGELMLELMDQGAQAMVLGCTEIPQMTNNAPEGLPLFDTTMLHAKAIVKHAFES